MAGMNSSHLSGGKVTCEIWSLKSHFKHRFASSIAASSLKPSSTGEKLVRRCPMGMQGIGTRFLSPKPFSFPSQGLGSSVSTNISSISPSPPRYLSIETAAFLPAAIESIIEAGPVTASPPANIPGKFVSRVFESTQTVLFSVILTSLGNDVRSGDWPMAAITPSSSMTYSEPSTANGLLLPLSSGSPNITLTNSMATTFPSFPIILLGAT